MGLSTTTSAQDRPQPGALPALLLLIAINLFNYVDRQVLAAVEPEIRRELLPTESKEMARFYMGLLSTAFLLSYMVSAPLFERLAERVSRWWIVGIGVGLWSLATGASGIHWGADLAFAFWLLMVTRLFVGVGEGAYGPVAPTMLSDLYPVKRRGAIIAWFYLALPIGGALGYTLGDEIVKHGLGWRTAFHVVMPPGLILAAICFFMRDPKRGAADAVAAPPRKLSWRDYLFLFTIPSYTIVSLGMTAMTFAIGALAYWMPDYLESVNAPPGSLSVFGMVTAGAGLCGTLAGGVAGDWLRGKVRGAYFIVSGTAMVLGFPFLLIFLYTPFPYAWIFGFLAVFSLFFNTGPTNTILANVTHPSLRAAGFALNIFFIHALGDAISPPVIGYIAGVWDMRVGFMVVSFAMVIGGMTWLTGARFLDRDTELAPERLREHQEPRP